MTVYGIDNCDTVKKAIAWLTTNKIDFSFVDFKKQVLSEKIIRKWIKAKGIEMVLNKKSTTWRNLPAEIQEQLLTTSFTAALLIKYPTLIKRPVVESEKNVFIGFNESIYQSIFIK